MVSVIVCTYNREKYLGRCLQHLADQRISPKAYEILIIDNKSTDSTASIAETFITDNEKLNTKYYLEQEQGHTFARNRGIKEAKGEILTFIDDDAFVRSDFIENIQTYFDTNHHVQAIGGKIVPVYEEEEPKWMSKYLLTLVSAIDLGDKPKEFKGNKFPIGANMSFREKVFQQYGSFNTELGRRAGGLEGGDEKEMFLRLKKNNELIHYVPNVEVAHIIPEKRTQKEYIKGLGIGVGSSEMKRLKHSTITEKLKKFLDEGIKIGGTFVLFFIYLFKGRFSAASMLVKFRLWVLKGLLKKA
ncbi:glycosyltransferase [Marivirga sp.]|uniref:glycosyltransferase n=1 Tax=Marivirga sp. TaxID=2018662 RepID=UPI0025CF7C92|nr:glycosyltransferase [Marivirga sp.]